MQKNTTADAIKELAEAIKSLEKKIDESYAIKKESEPVDKPVPEVPKEPETPFPLEWRMAIDEVLSPLFSAKVNYRGDGKFELSIFVPKEYSNARPSDWDINKEDKRFKVTDNALGVVGVRDYASQVAENLGKDIMLKVAEDKMKLKGV